MTSATTSLRINQSNRRKMKSNEPDNHRAESAHPIHENGKERRRLRMPFGHQPYHLDGISADRADQENIEEKPDEA